MIEINGRGKTNRRLFAGNFLSTVLITFVGTAICCFLLFSIGFQSRPVLAEQVKTTDQEEAELSPYTWVTCMHT